MPFEHALCPSARPATISLTPLIPQVRRSERRANLYTPLDRIPRTLGMVGARSFAQALERTGQGDELHGAQPFTILAPSDEALAELPAALLDQPIQLHRLLAFHIIPGQAIDQAELAREPGLATAAGQRVHVEREEDGSIHVDGARLVRGDIRIGAGIVHLVDRVMIPAELDLIELLHISDSFTRLITACEVLGLEGLLRGALAYTVLAPRGLAALPTWDWHALLRPDARERLGSLIRRHIVAGRIYLEPGTRLRNLEGGLLGVSGAHGRLEIAGHRAMLTDVDARNGLIHVIDGMIV